MPWINEEICTGCEICVNECCVSAISMNEAVALINQNKCIRCGVCHDVCPTDAVRHDGEKIPEEVESNLTWAIDLLEHEYYLNDKKKQKQLIERLLRYFIKNRKVIEKTIERLKVLQNTKYID
jgi:Indolepyruvate ferredoxin oxidoreductase, alpha and beta subunits